MLSMRTDIEEATFEMGDFRRLHKLP